MMSMIWIMMIINTDDHDYNLGDHFYDGDD